MKKIIFNGALHLVPTKISLKMRLTTLLLIVSLFQIQANTYSQNTKISLDLKNVTVLDVLQKIESKTDFNFFYNNKDFDLKRRVTAQVKKKSINYILDKLFKNSAVLHSVTDKQIVLYPDPNPILEPTSSESVKKDVKEIKGLVTDADGTPLPSVSVIIVGTKIGTETDFDGNFTINANEGDVLEFSYIGMKTQRVIVGKTAFIKVQLEDDAASLQEVVIVGFGAQKKENVTGAVSSINMGEVLGDRPVTNALQAIQGTVPGLQITTNSGQPGAEGLGVNIRGYTSINGGAALVLMDNVPVDISDVNPQDIETITVLKDAAATSIYGARAAFGVILITTKKAEKNQPIKFNYSSTFSFSTPEDIPDKANTYDFVHALQDWGVSDYWTGQNIDTWAGFLEENRANPGQYPNGYAEYEGLRYPIADTDVLGEFLDDKGFTQIHNFNFSGGAEKVSYRVSAGYSNADGIIVTDNDSFEKFTLNTNLSVDLTSNFKSSTTIAYRDSKRTSPIGDYYSAINYGPFVPASGNHVFEDGTEVPYATPANMESLKVAPEKFENNIRLFQKFEFNPLEGLDLVAEYTLEKRTSDTYTGDNQVLTVNPQRYTLNGVDPELTYYRKANYKHTYKALNVYAKYAKSIGNHNMSALLGMNKEERQSESFWVKKTNLINVDLPSISQATGTITSDDSFGEWAVMGYFGRLNYNYKEKYFLELNGRYDGSSRFPEDDRFGFFPSFSTGWNIGKEAFMENISFLNHFKLRGSWGEIGNQRVSYSDGTQNYYPAIPGMGSYNANWINSATGLKYVTLDSPSLVSPSFTWERVETTNIGFDARAFKNRLSTSFDWYIRNTLGMLAPGSKLPDVLGAEAPQQNSADLQSKGWEFEMSWKDNINDFSYRLGVTLSDNQTEITDYNNPGGLLSQYYVGRKIGEIWGYVTDGYYTTDDFVAGTLDENLMGGTLKEGIPAYKGKSQNPGDIKYKDLNGDGEIFSGDGTLEDPGDTKIIGNSTRRYKYGIFGNGAYKNFDFSFLLSGVAKRDVYKNNNVRFPYVTEFSVVFQDQLDYWTPENTDAYFPRNYPRGGVNYGNSRRTQTKYMLDGSYLRVKNITIGYSIPNSILTKNKIDKLRVFLSAENPFVFSDWPDGINTELVDKSNGATYPYLRSFNVGLNLSF